MRWQRRAPAQLLPCKHAHHTLSKPGGEGRWHPSYHQPVVRRKAGRPGRHRLQTILANEKAQSCVHTRRRRANAPRSLSSIKALQQPEGGHLAPSLCACQVKQRGDHTRRRRAGPAQPHRARASPSNACAGSKKVVVGDTSRHPNSPVAIAIASDNGGWDAPPTRAQHSNGDHLSGRFPPTRVVRGER
eukprot:scaffold58454_cov31-Tisochrysis_lutea.AAC.6